MQKLLLISAVSLSAAYASAINKTVTFQGLDTNQNICMLRLDAEVDDGVEESQKTIYAQLSINGYTFRNIDLKLNDSNPEIVGIKSLQIDDGGKKYHQVIGAPITIGNIGLVELSGLIKTDAAGSPEKYEVQAKGGVLNWWRKKYSCSDLQIVKD